MEGRPGGPKGWYLDGDGEGEGVVGSGSEGPTTRWTHVQAGQRCT